MKGTDDLLQFIGCLSGITLGIIVGVMLLFLLRYRRRPGVEPSSIPTQGLPLLIILSLLTCGLLVVLFCWGFTGYVNLTTPPADAIKIRVIAKQSDFTFTFIYPNGASEKKSTTNPRPALHVPVDHAVEFQLESTDVVHSFFIPRFRVKQDIVPGRSSECWFEAKDIPEEGDEPWLFCSEICGDEHSIMSHKVIVQSRADYDAYVAGLLGPPDGEDVFNVTCLVCHTTTSEAKVGPGLGGIYGTTRKVFDVKQNKVIDVIADEAYFLDSIMNPGDQLSRTGGTEFGNLMTPTLGSTLTEEEIKAVISYLKTLK